MLLFWKFGKERKNMGRLGLPEHTASDFLEICQRAEADFSEQEFALFLQRQGKAYRFINEESMKGWIDPEEREFYIKFIEENHISDCTMRQLDAHSKWFFNVLCRDAQAPFSYEQWALFVQGKGRVFNWARLMFLSGYLLSLLYFPYFARKFCNRSVWQMPDRRPEIFF